MPVSRIVVGLDGSEESVRALEWAVRQAGLTGSRLQVITVWQWPAMYGTAPMPEIDYEGDTRRAVVGRVDEVRAHHPDLEIDFDVVAGPAAQALVQASSGAELLVVGSRGHGAFAGALIGSVSLHCVHQAHCPVVVIRSH